MAAGRRALLLLRSVAAAQEAARTKGLGAAAIVIAVAARAAAEATQVWYTEQALSNVACEVSGFAVNSLSLHAQLVLARTSFVGLLDVTRASIDTAESAIAGLEAELAELASKCACCCLRRLFRNALTCRYMLPPPEVLRPGITQLSGYELCRDWPLCNVALRIM